MDRSSQTLTLPTNFKGFLKAIRIPNLLIIVITQYLTRIFLIGPKAEWLSFLGDLHFMLLPFASVCIAAGGYLINDYYDIKIDTINKPERVVVGFKLRRRLAIFSHFVLNILGVGIAFLLSIPVGTVCFFGGFFLWLYSNQLKRMPFIGNFVVALVIASTIPLVSLYFEASNYMIYVFSLFIFFSALIREILKDIEDIRGDMHFGSKTLPVLFGIRKTKWIVYVVLSIFIATVVVLLMLLQHKILFYYFLVMLLPAGYFTYQLYWADTKKAYHKLRIFWKFVMISGMLMMTVV